MAVKTEIFPGISLTSIKTDKFKTGLLSIDLLQNLSDHNASRNALLPHLLRRGNARLKDMETFAAELDELYGAYLEPTVRKKGEVHCVGLLTSFVEDRFVRSDRSQLDGAIGILCETLANPLLDCKKFRNDYMESERANLVDRINAQKNDKVVFASNRLIEQMCEGEAYGVNLLGDERSAAAIDDGLYDYYLDLLSNARIEAFYCGSEDHARIADRLAKELEALKRTNDIYIPRTEVKTTCGKLREFDEGMDVTQGKLSLGFRTGITGADPDFPAMLLFSTIYGGCTTSKLFLNVREKMSLCYYASASYDRIKGVMTVNSGVEFDTVDSAKQEILAQLEICRKGDIQDWEIDGARAVLINSLKSIGDSQSALEEYYLGRAAAGLEPVQPESIISSIAAVTVDQVVAAANKINLDAIYFLHGNK